MRRALEFAAVARDRGDVPVGAVVVIAAQAVAVGFNQKEANHDPTAHAEIVALRQAAARLGGWRLSGATLYVTKEPCVMCAAACVAARIERVVYGCADPKGGGAGSVLDITGSPKLNHQVRVEGGLLAAEASELLREFFRQRREAEL
jgi:tRNA(adenine34) deaminase